MVKIRTFLNLLQGSNNVFNSSYIFQHVNGFSHRSEGTNRVARSDGDVCNSKAPATSSDLTLLILLQTSWAFLLSLLEMRVVGCMGTF